MLSAQKSDFSTSLWFGIKGGVHFSKYQFVPSVSQNQHLGKQGGIALRLDLERGASAQIELNYVQTGWSERYDELGKTSERQIHYVELPLLTHLYVGKKAVRFFVNVGPFLGYHLEDKHIVAGTDFDTRQLERQTLPIKYKLAWGLMAGPGISLQLGGRHRFDLEARIAYNFQDIWGHKRSDPYGQSTELRMGASLGYMFKF